ncbi:MAG: rRNA maturation RNase YbeY [Candidatus Saccharimonadales bacterium]
MINIYVEGGSSQHIEPLAKILSDLSDYSGDIEARVISGEEVKQLNKDYAGNDYSTDVLSFSNLETNGYLPEGSSVLGQVFISKDHISSQAKASGTDKETEFILLLLHGCLHILKYDHAKESDRFRMNQLQAKIMSSMGLKYRDFNWQ